MKNKSVTLLLPTLNEIEGFKKIYPTIDKKLFDEILVVDGGSTDGTLEYATSQGLSVLIQKEKGLAAGVMEAVNHINTDCIIEFSLDGNCLIEQLPELINNLRAGTDLVVISRYLPPAKSEDDNLVTALGNWLFTKMIRFLGKHPITDSLTIYRGFNKKIVCYPEFKACLYGPVFEPLISAVAQARGLSILEIPGDEPARIGGESKMRVIYNGSCILLMIVKMYWFKWFRYKRQMQK